MSLRQEQLTERQRLAWDWAMNTEKNLFISGFAGTGKTALILKVKEDLEERGRKIRAAAFTGLAAQKLEGTTVARMLGLVLAKTVREIEGINWREAERNLEGVTDIVLDEVSMCSGDFLELVDQVMRQVKENDRPWGGLRMIFGGDFLQLPPVHTPQDPPAHWGWAFQYPQFLRCHGIYLNESMRQRDPEEVRLLNQFRRGIISEEGRRFLDGAVSRKLKHPAELHGRKRDAAKINHQRLAALEGKARTYGTLTDPERLRKLLMDQVPIEESITLKVGAPVIVLANDSYDQYANGSQGIVEKLRFDHVEVRLHNGKLIPIEYKTWTIGESLDRKFGEVEGLPLHLGWAATIHRAQGLTLDEVRADIAPCWEPGQAYVALSRTPSLEQFSLVQPVRSIKVSSEVLEFVHQLEVNTA